MSSFYARFMNMVFGNVYSTIYMELVGEERVKKRPQLLLGAPPPKVSLGYSPRLLLKTLERKSGAALRFFSLSPPQQDHLINGMKICATET